MRQPGRRKLYGFCFGVLSLGLWEAGCTRRVPEQLTDREKWLDVLCDLQVLQSAVENAPFQLRDSLSRVYTGQLLEIHDITQDQLDGLVNFLAEDLTRAAEWYDQCAVKLEEQAVGAEEEGSH